MPETYLTHTLPATLSNLTFAEVVFDWALPVMMLDRELRFVFANPAYLATVERDWAEIEGRHVLDAFPETQDREEITAARFRRTLAGHMTSVEAAPYNVRAADGETEVRYWEAVNSPVRDADGRVAYLVQHSRDVTARIEDQRDRSMIAKEITHRTKNVLAVVQSIARMTGRGDQSKADFIEDFNARLATMSRAHTRLYDNEFHGIDLAELMKDEISCMALSRDWELSGTPVRISGKSARDLAMILHELATNAAKHGCFAKENGRLMVSWDEDGDGRLIVVWQESGVGPVELPDETGFGTKLLRMIPTIECHRTGTDDGIRVTLTCVGYATDAPA